MQFFNGDTFTAKKHTQKSFLPVLCCWSLSWVAGKLWGYFSLSYLLHSSHPARSSLNMNINLQSWARGNRAATTWPCFQATTKLLDFAFLLRSLWQLHLDTETLIFFNICLVPEDLMPCRIVVKLNNCRVPSSVSLSNRTRII